jgi:hypothetical protein
VVTVVGRVVWSVVIARGNSRVEIWIFCDDGECVQCVYVCVCGRVCARERREVKLFGESVDRILGANVVRGAHGEDLERVFGEVVGCAM